MTEVTNNHHTALAMPDGTAIAAKETKSFDNWAENAKNGVVAHWVEVGLLSVSGDDTDDADGDEKDVLIAKLAELGIKADKRASVEKLQEKLEEALAK